MAGVWREGRAALKWGRCMGVCGGGGWGWGWGDHKRSGRGQEPALVSQVPRLLPPDASLTGVQGLQGEQHILPPGGRWFCRRLLLLRSRWCLCGPGEAAAMPPVVLGAQQLLPGGWPRERC